ncbi:MAG: hypothetical protein KY446_04115 [Proteobacteria bacterium]|nr:hypothetical protein [Pseudomonadota bacterium]
MTDTTINGGEGGQGGQASGGGSSPLAGLQSVAQNAASQFNERSQAARDWASMQTDVARQTVVERPFVSAGAAFAAGVVFGVLLARR